MKQNIFDASSADLSNGRPAKGAVLAAIVLSELLLSVLFWAKGLKITVAAGLLITLLLYFMQSARRVAWLFGIYLTVLPTSAWGQRYELFHGLAFNFAIFMAFAVLLMLYNGLEQHSNLLSTKKDAATLVITIWMAVTALSILNGLQHGQNTYIIKTEGVLLASYGLIIPFKHVLSRIDKSKLINGFLVLGSLAAVIYLLLYAKEGGLQGLRIVTRQPHVALAVLPLALFKMMTSPGKLNRIIYTVISLALAGTILLSQQRGLWMGMAAAVSGFALFSSIHPQDRKRLAWGLLMLTLVFAGAVGWLIHTQPAATLSLLKRLISLLWGLSDPSMQLRFLDTQRVMAQWAGSPASILWGCGLGAFFESIDPMRTSPHYIDHSWIYLLWKTGLLGTVTLAALYLNVFIKGVRAIHFKTSSDDRLFIGALLGGLLGLLAVSFTNGCLVFYRFIPVWCALIAAVLIECRHKTTHRPVE